MSKKLLSRPFGTGQAQGRSWIRFGIPIHQELERSGNRECQNIFYEQPADAIVGGL